jgi:hypothetical protein
MQLTSLEKRSDDLRTGDFEEPTWSVTKPGARMTAAVAGDGRVQHLLAIGAVVISRTRRLIDDLYGGRGHQEVQGPHLGRHVPRGSGRGHRAVAEDRRRFTG